MSDFLIQHAVENVWCSGDHDHQHIFKPAKLSPYRGVRRVVEVEWDKLPLPTQEHYYHVYQIGQLSPVFLKLLPDTQTWYSAQEAINNLNITINVYNEDGRHYPNFTVFFKKTRTRNLIVAVRDLSVIERQRDQAVYIRFYSNAFFESDRSHPTADLTKTEGTFVKNNADVVNLQQKVDTLAIQHPGKTIYFVNGWKVDAWRLVDIKIGDVVQYLHDTSIKKTFTVKIGDLDTFISELDRTRKYLLKRPNQHENVIDYHDDLDFWITEKKNGREKGIFYHKASERSVRMVTHQDYSLPVQTILDHVRKIEGWHDPHEYYLIVSIRKSGYERPLVNEHNRLHELFKMPDSEIEKALLGAHSTLPEWRAASLEHSLYTQIMRSQFTDISNEVVTQAYGYNAVSKLVGDTPQVPVSISGKMGVKAPYRLRYHSTAFEYDVNGRLIDYYYHDEGRYYWRKNEHCGYVEIIAGRFTDGSSTTFNVACVPVAPGASYKVYVSERVGGVSTNEWRLAIPIKEYVFHNNEIVWLDVHANVEVAVRDDSKFLTRTLNLRPLNGMLRFTVMAEDNYGGDYLDKPLPLKPEKLDLWLNSHPLIENLDYFVRWPEVVICNKEFLKPHDVDQTVVVRATGFPYNCNHRRPREEFGFVEHGLLSRNNRFDLRDDKVMRFVVEGRIYQQSDLKFSETDSGLRMDNVRNGAPYLIDDIVVPMSDITTRETYTFRDESRELDKRISDYLTTFYPEPKIDLPSIIERRYQIFSPFLSRIHHDLVQGFYYPEGIKGQYSDEKIKEWVKDYEWLLTFDPVINGVDECYVIVHPHHLFTETELDVYQYTFLTRINQVYLQSKVDISGHIKIKERWI